MNLIENHLQLGFLLYFCCSKYKYFRHPVLPKTLSTWNIAMLQEKRAVHAGWSDQIPVPIPDSFFPYKMPREGGRKETLNSTTKHRLRIYLFICSSALCPAERDASAWERASCSGKAPMLVWEVNRLSGLLSPLYLNHSLARMATWVLCLCLIISGPGSIIFRGTC